MRVRWASSKSDRSMDDDESDYADFGERPKGDDDMRGRSLLKGNSQAQSPPLPKPGGPKEFEVVGLPLAETDWDCVVEAESAALGNSLLEKGRHVCARWRW